MKIVGLARYPVKGMRGESVAAADVEPQGIVGDRRYMAVDENGVFLSQREAPQLATITATLTDDGVTLSAGADVVSVRPAYSMPPERAVVWRDSVPVVGVEPSADAFLAAILNRPARLVYQSAPDSRPVDTRYARAEDRVSLADGYPLLLTHVASLDDLNGRLDAPVGMERFRPNVVVEGGAPWDEDDWRFVATETVRLEAVKPCGRCTVTTRDQVSGEQPHGEEPLRTLTRFRMRRGIGPVFGQNLVPRTLGTLHVGEAISGEG